MNRAAALSLQTYFPESRTIFLKFSLEISQYNVAGY